MILKTVDGLNYVSQVIGPPYTDLSAATFEEIYENRICRLC